MPYYASPRLNLAPHFHLLTSSAKLATAIAVAVVAVSDFGLLRPIRRGGAHPPPPFLPLPLHKCVRDVRVNVDQWSYGAVVNSRPSSPFALNRVQHANSS